MSDTLLEIEFEEAKKSYAKLEMKIAFGRFRNIVNKLSRKDILNYREKIIFKGAYDYFQICRKELKKV